ncbi:MAG TPA: acyl-CoA thioesterase domain-containing protein [Acidimicrobiales bacterium]
MNPRPTATATYPHGADLELIPFHQGPDRDECSFLLTDELARHDGLLYGGTAAAATVMAMEAATQRDAIWVLTQFVAQTGVGERITVVVRKLAEGSHVAQLQVTATAGERLIFCALGATGHARPNGLTGQFDTMPTVTPPEASRPVSHGRPERTQHGANPNLEYREATYEPSLPPGRIPLWARLTAGRDLTRAAIAYLADRVPRAITRGAGRMQPDAAQLFTAWPPGRVRAGVGSVAASGNVNSIAPPLMTRSRIDSATTESEPANTSPRPGSRP